MVRQQVQRASSRHGRYVQLTVPSASNSRRGPRALFTLDEVKQVFVALVQREAQSCHAGRVGNSE